MDENKIIDVEPIEEEIKQINPTMDKDNYLIQIIADGKVIKESIALNSTVKIVHIGNQSLAIELK